MTDMKVDSTLNTSTNKLLLLVVTALLGLGGIQGAGMMNGGDEASSRDIEDVKEVVTRTDPNGVPLVYVPRELVEGQHRIIEVLEQIREDLRQR